MSACALSGSCSFLQNSIFLCGIGCSIRMCPLSSSLYGLSDANISKLHISLTLTGVIIQGEWYEFHKFVLDSGFTRILVHAQNSPGLQETSSFIPSILCNAFLVLVGHETVPCKVDKGPDLCVPCKGGWIQPFSSDSNNMTACYIANTTCNEGRYLP